MSKKPSLKLIEDGNINALADRAASALTQSGGVLLAREMKNKVASAYSFADAVSIISEYIDFF